MLDGDSIMPAETMVTLARTMEGNDTIGLIQAMLYEINSPTLCGRMRSFAYNPGILISYFAMFYFRLGRAPYYGHNSILRTEAITKHCSLPILQESRFFSAGKPKSHDFFEAVLLEGAGWETWYLPTCPSYDEQMHNIITATIREERWIHGAMDWLALVRFKNLSSFGRATILFSTLNYYLAVGGLIIFMMTYFGLYYMVTHPLLVGVILQRYGYLLELQLIPIFFFILTKIVAPIIVLYKQYYRAWTPIVKYLFSYCLNTILFLMIGPITMLLLVRVLWNWFWKKRIVWGSQDRTARVLSWDECFKFLWLISVFGLGCAYFFLFYIVPNVTPTVERLIGFSLTGILYFLGLPIVGLVFAPVVARVTSRTFPWMERMGWFKHQFEGENEPLVVRETRNMTSWFEEQIAEEWGFEQALSDPYFALRHLAQCPSRPQKYAFWKNKLAGRNIQDLTRLEKLVVFRCRELWEMFMTKNFDVSREKSQ